MKKQLVLGLVLLTGMGASSLKAPMVVGVNTESAIVVGTVMQSAQRDAFLMFIESIMKQGLLPAIIANNVSVTTKGSQPYTYTASPMLYNIATLASEKQLKTTKLKDEEWLHKATSLFFKQQNINEMSVKDPALAALGNDRKRVQAFRDLSNFYHTYSEKTTSNPNFTYQELVEAGRQIVIKVKALLPKNIINPIGSFQRR